MYFPIKYTVGNYSKLKGCTRFSEAISDFPTAMAMRHLLCVFALTLSTCVASQYTCATCSSYAAYVGQDATQYCQDSNSKCWDPSDCTGVGELCNVDHDHPAEYPPGGSKSTGIATCNTCSSHEYLEGAAEAYYCQDSNNKCWNSIDCTGVGSLCQAAKAGCASKKYTWIGASAGTDEWCNENCNHNPSFCPAEDCGCTATDTCSMDTSVCQCPYGPAHQFCVSDAECPNEGSYCMNGDGKVGPFVCHVPNKQLSMTVQIHNVSSSDFHHDQQQVFRQAVWSGIKNYIRSTDNIAYNSDDDSDGEHTHHRRSLLSTVEDEQANRRANKLSCTWIGASAGSDSWCNSNCNNNPSFCPASSCKCAGGISSDYCATTYPKNNHEQCDQDPKCRWWRGSGKNHCMSSTICNPCSSYAFLQVGYSNYCQDSNDKCWSSADCTGVGSLCTVGIPTSIPQCCSSLCAAKPNATTAAPSQLSSAAPTPPPSVAPTTPSIVVFVNNCTSDSDCGDSDGNYCMIDPSKSPPYVCHTSSVKMSFNVGLSNASKALYNSAADTLNHHMDSDSATRRSGGRITDLINSMASASHVANMQVTSVSVLAQAQSYDAYCDAKTAADGCVDDGHSSDGGLSTVGVVFVVLGCLLAVALVIGGVWFYHSRKVGSGSMNEALLPEGECDDYKRMPDIPKDHTGCNNSNEVSIFDQHH